MNVTSQEYIDQLKKTEGPSTLRLAVETVVFLAALGGVVYGLYILIQELRGTTDSKPPSKRQSTDPPGGSGSPDGSPGPDGPVDGVPPGSPPDTTGPPASGSGDVEVIVPWDIIGYCVLGVVVIAAIAAFGVSRYRRNSKRQRAEEAKAKLEKNKEKVELKPGMNMMDPEIRLRYQMDLSAIPEETERMREAVSSYLANKKSSLKSVTRKKVALINAVGTEAFEDAVKVVNTDAKGRKLALLKHMDKHGPLRGEYSIRMASGEVV